MSRGGPKINRAGDDLESAEMPDWLGAFADSLGKPKNAVEVARVRDTEAQEYSILNQISRLVNNEPHSAHATVDSVVREMRERTGLNEYLRRLSSSKDDLKKNSADQQGGVVIDVKLPESLSKYKSCAEDIANYIKNTIENMHGIGATIPQLQHDILHTFGRRHGLEVKDVMNDDVAKYLNDAIVSAQTGIPPEEHNPHIGAGVGRTEGETDEDRDAFAILTPATD